MVLAVAVAVAAGHMEEPCSVITVLAQAVVEVAKAAKAALGPRQVQVEVVHLESM
jgi:hypothetical protein